MEYTSKSDAYSVLRISTERREARGRKAFRRHTRRATVFK